MQAEGLLFRDRGECSLHSILLNGTCHVYLHPLTLCNIWKEGSNGAGMHALFRAVHIRANRYVPHGPSGTSMASPVPVHSDQPIGLGL